MKHLEAFMDNLEQGTDTPVYCQDCRFSRLASGREWWCTHPHALVFNPTWWTPSYRLTPSEKNAHNDCPDFVQERWWDFFREAQVLWPLGTLMGLILGVLFLLWLSGYGL